ncbi:hypothetical protein V8G54_007593 [Vigna mungo]|uniref:SEC63 domain-containing protein n=1 Tax=Vigna mungo TaxID=3915 RepID=A0AAQ3P3N3_VIGMU
MQAYFSLYLPKAESSVDTFEDLEDSGCIKMDEEKVEPMMLGSIASQYYLSYMTVSMFGSNIGPDTSLEVFLHILSAASEFDELPVRHNESPKERGVPIPLVIENNALEKPLTLQVKDSKILLPGHVSYPPLSKTRIHSTLSLEG